MRVTRRQLRQLIKESVSSLLNESAYERMLSQFRASPEEGTSAGFLKIHDQYKEAALLHYGGAGYGQTAAGSDKEGIAGSFKMASDVMEAIAKATKKDLTRKDYYIWTGLDDFWESGMQKIPAMGQRGDPYLYQGVGEPNSRGVYRKLRVVAGPEPKRMGFEFKNIRQVELEEEDFLGGLSQKVKSSSGSSGSSSDSSDSSDSGSSGSSF
tara:strand:+ start:73 stop:702 length:630 start_codon:yes stop_codon:yes gene_type:complete